MVSRKGGVDRQCPKWLSASRLRRLPKSREHCLEGTKWIEFVVHPKSEDFVINTKRRYSTFYGTDLETLLRSLGVDTLILTGVTTDCCILNSAFDAVNRDLKVIVPIDCTEALSEENKKYALKFIDLALGWVSTSNETLQLMREKLK